MHARCVGMLRGNSESARQPHLSSSTTAACLGPFSRPRVCRSALHGESACVGQGVVSSGAEGSRCCKAGRQRQHACMPNATASALELAACGSVGVKLDHLHPPHHGIVTQGLHL